MVSFLKTKDLSSIYYTTTSYACVLFDNWRRQTNEASIFVMDMRGTLPHQDILRVLYMGWVSMGLTNQT